MVFRKDCNRFSGISVGVFNKTIIPLTLVEYEIVYKPNKMQGWHYDKGTLLLANISASTTSLLKGQCYTEKYVTVLKFKKKRKQV